MKNVYFIILCGGSGTRLWPLSRKNRPKQLIPFLNGTSLLEQTIDRMSTIAHSKEHIGIITTAEQHSLIPDHVKEKIGFSLQEPTGRNTGPAILYGCLELEKKVPNAITVFLAADHFILDTKTYCSYLKKAIEYAKQNNKIVTLGLMPTHPATGYGYIQASNTHPRAGIAYPVKRFHEKPNLERAKKYLAQGNMFWNLSMFIGQNKLFLEEYKILAHEMTTQVKHFFETGHGYEKAEATSIDYAIMEKSKKIAVIPCDFEWNDVGNLDMFLSIQQRYEPNKTKIVAIDSKNNIVKVNKKIVSFIGVDDLCVVEDEDTLIISKRNCVEKVKQIREKENLS